MNSQGKEYLKYDDEINLYDLWKVIVKRKILIIGIFLTSTIATALISLQMPKIYRGDVILRVASKATTVREIANILGELEREKLEGILPKTHSLVVGIRFVALKDSADKVQVTIEAKNLQSIPAIISEFVVYLSNFPLIKSSVENEKELLTKKSEELSHLIASSKKMVATYWVLLKEGRFVPVGFNPIELDSKVSDLKIERISVEQAIRDLKGVHVIDQYISSRSVKPIIVRNLVLAGIAGLFIGIGGAFSIEKMKSSEALP